MRFEGCLCIVVQGEASKAGCDLSIVEALESKGSGLEVDFKRVVREEVLEERRGEAFAERRPKGVVSLVKEEVEVDFPKATFDIW